MDIIRYATARSVSARVGVLDEGTITELSGTDSIAALLRLPTSAIRQRLTDSNGVRYALNEVAVLPPVDGRTEVWACGVTYTVSRSARAQESERSATVYEQVYDAVRPELFFKSVAWRVVGDGELIAIREDSDVDVPEPEVAVVVNALGEIVGYTVCNDVSSRTIEGENPLYLPQAKIYLGACAVGPTIRPAWEIADPYALPVTMTIRRGGQVVWHGSASTSQLHRRFVDLVEFLLRADAFPDGVILSTGTCLVPALPFTLAPGDRVRIEVGDVGVLTNDVVRGVSPMSWLADTGAAVSVRARRAEQLHTQEKQ